MTIALDLPPDVEARLRHRAAAEGIDPASLAVRVLGETLAKEPSLRSEAELLREINVGFGPASWDRLRSLAERCQSGLLSDSEQQEYLTLADQLEEADARRMELIVELAKRRGESVERVVQSLGLSMKEANG